jgi:pyruvate formate lyase activating enzyme
LAAAIAEVQRYANSLKRMNGGVTLSGGEPLMQDRFVMRVLEAAHAMGVHTALETNGYFGDRLSDDELGGIDLVLLDMKAFTLEQHKRVAGIANEPVIAFARRLAALGRPMWLRYVLVPGLTDIPEEMARLAEFAAGLGVVERVEILPFHQLGAYKWDKLGLDYQLHGVEMPTREQIDAAIAVFAAAGLRAC